MSQRHIQLLLAAVALLGSCYDTPLIPDTGDDDDEPSRSGASTAGASVSTAGKAGKGGAGSGGSPQGGSPPRPSGGGGAGTIAGGAGGGQANDAGQAGEPAAPGISWLVLAEDEAPATVEPNQELNIQGAFYAYSDSCVAPQLHWDPETRCISGQLCNPHVDPDAWGVAIGFDFRNTGDSGTPPDTKLLWNPNDVGARGIAWHVSGPLAPGFQVWVLNMDSSWGGQCDQMSCEVAGPPDGVDVADLDGELLFSTMRKDDWGGGGIHYDFDPAAVHALQFKLPAIRVPNAKFDLCLDAVGIIH